MKLISWNVNGLRAVMRKMDFLSYLKEEDADIICLQETKIQDGQVDLQPEDYHVYWNYAVKKGYSGTAVFSKQEPLQVIYGIGVEEHDQEGRVITLEFENVFVMTVYTPNSRRGLERIDYRMQWEEALLSYILELDQKKPVILCGDLNVAHQEIDLKNPKANRNNAGFSDQEREAFTRFLEAGFVDSFRHVYPDLEGAYSWWSYRAGARDRNIGWRIDYFVVSESLKEQIEDASISADVMGSDHCPVELIINI
ncbi:MULTISPECIES: exodeoxyribonuclease III [Bacillaceae]|uniref:Exodeoxyribonuclease n=4 Tax=Bacillus TaxID=1386 RepID=EXOA_BACSU|nr:MULTISPECIES: exodeoxyribonuclease III [Bacillales]NP_391968.1 apurinic/apyrimidinic endonuclease [Bacillus subtilis subsp. subtilis str. 168]P37454.1 RecName: Full=Exodeoxyribonuclease [Bacillus subtilis subsp. subtilis str. 168]5CFE_A Chain A, Exodeoxyribonuclease [Bacillus subtilis subsp. subtilis str. 168]MBG9709305.1 exodeoxyribonuclease III [Lysinibacillus sphaericus]BAM56182.1 apurinic/apyrimidinic endonuclease [Bacillus subtilis BEST7613]AFQ59946.1 Apurinic/apyrimidinic endonucleas